MILLSLLSLFTIVNCQKIIDLSHGYWTVESSSKTIKINATVPGGIYSDLINGGVLKEYIFGKGNDVAYRWVGRTDWAYSTHFTLMKYDLSYKNVNITFHGVDTIAEIYLNSKQVGTCENMFTRYSFDIKSAAQEGVNNLTVKFTSPIDAAKYIAQSIPYKIPPECWPKEYNGECHINKLRKMQASFAWDWGPAFPSMGIWKPVHIELNNGPVLRSVGTFLTTEIDYWRLTVRLWFDGVGSAIGNVSVALNVPPSNIYTATETIIVDPNQIRDPKIVLLIPKDKVDLWWPNGYGRQPLYKLLVKFYADSGEVSRRALKIGFRTIEIIQDAIDIDPTKGQRFYFKVNDLPIFAKGSNWIPSHILPEETEDKQRILTLLQSAADANFNMLRVWGGGIYESDYFYSVCDQLGILIWQDLMFACNMYPSTDEFLNSVMIEVSQQIKRIQYHPSIAVIAGNNENEAALRQNWYGTSGAFSLYKSDYIKLYVNTIQPIVSRLDPQRSYLTSSPSNGIQTIRENYVAKNPQSNLYGDVHYYNYLGDVWDWMIYPRPRFVSEYGIQSYPLMSTLRKVFEEKDLVWDSGPLQARQHSPRGNDYIKLQMDKNLPTAINFSDIVYLTQIHQAMGIKTETELYRRLRSSQLSTGEGLTMGALYWQLNDVWEAPSWSSIDFHGNWKMLHYYARDFFSNVIVSPFKTIDNKLGITIVSDLTYQLDSNLTISVYYWDKLEPYITLTYDVEIAPGKSEEYLERPLHKFIGNIKNFEDCFLTFSLTTDPLTSVPSNFLFPTILKYSNFNDTTVVIDHIYKTSEYTAEITLKTEKIALFVWLESKNDDFRFIFSKNGFHMVEETTVVSMVSQSQPIGDGELLELVSVRNLKRSYTTDSH